MSKLRPHAETLLRPKDLCVLCVLCVEYTPQMIKRLLIANRGEIAVRIIRACREMGIESVAVYSEADAHARHVAGRGPGGRDRAGAARRRATCPSLACSTRRAASGADAVHPGYGFLSENAAFAEACERAGLVFVGPPASVIAQMGSKIEARRLVSAAGVPVVPGETPDDQSDRGLTQAVERVGLPALVKASAGGGGKGMRTVREAAEIEAAIQAARREAGAAFGDGTLYVERLVERAAARRGADVRRRARTRRAPLRARLLGAAAPPEGDRGEPVARGDAGAARAHHRARPSPRHSAVGYRNAGTIEFLRRRAERRRVRSTSWR